MLTCSQCGHDEFDLLKFPEMGWHWGFGKSTELRPTGNEIYAARCKKCKRVVLSQPFPSKEKQQKLQDDLQYLISKMKAAESE